MTVTTSYESTTIGTHDTCGGEVRLLTSADAGRRFCCSCADQGATVRLKEERPSTKQPDDTVRIEPSLRQRALAFVGRTLHPGFLIDAKVEKLIEPFASYMPFSLLVHRLDVVAEPGVGWRVVRRP